MLTTKQNEIIEQIKQEFESHNQVIDLRKQRTSLFNFESIISDIQEKEDFLAEQAKINIASYATIEYQVYQELKLLNNELKVLGLVASLYANVSEKGSCFDWSVFLSKINAKTNHDKNLMSINVIIEREKLSHKAKIIEGFWNVIPKYQWRYSSYISKDIVTLMKNEYIREHLTSVWQRSIKDSI
jgi:hypothetical protein